MKFNIICGNNRPSISRQYLEKHNYAKLNRTNSAILFDYAAEFVLESLYTSLEKAYLYLGPLHFFTSYGQVNTIVRMQKLQYEAKGVTHSQP